MTQPTLAAADRLAARAKRLIAAGDNPGAVQLQLEAVQGYQTYYDAELAGRERDAAAREQALPVVHRLADYYGRLGGAQRRDGQLPEALESYRRGADLEAEWQLDDSYNQTNKILLSLLSRAATLTELGDEISRVAELVRVQVDGTRRDQWWAWADLGLLRLLEGRLADALWAYDHFTEAGARPADYGSTLTVLRQVRAELSPAPPGLLDDVSVAIDRLERGQSAS